MSRKRPRFIEIGFRESDGHETRQEQGFGSRVAGAEAKGCKGKLAFVSRSLVLIFLLFFLRFSEAHLANPNPEASRRSDLLGSSTGFYDPIDPNKGFSDPNIVAERARQAENPPAENPETPLDIPDTSSAPVEQNVSQNPLETEAKEQVSNKRPAEESGEPDSLAPEAKKTLLSGPRNRRHKRSEQTKSASPDRPFAKRLARPVTSNQDSLLDVVPQTEQKPELNDVKPNKPAQNEVRPADQLEINDVKPADQPAQNVEENAPEAPQNNPNGQNEAQPLPDNPVQQNVPVAPLAEPNPGTGAENLVQDTAAQGTDTPPDTAETPQPQENQQPEKPAENRVNLDELEPVEGSHVPPQNAFKLDKKPTLFQQQEETQAGQEATPVADDDFDPQEVERANTGKVDPRITQEPDSAWLKKQKQSQVIGSKIPVATSYEYNRSAHVLEPKFESPKVMGGIIQTLTDKEAKLRRAEKRKLKIQHDLNLYISKESAHVVNMLNNGDVNRLQKVHPLVYLRLQEVFQTQAALDTLVKKDGDKVKRYDKSWYLNSPPTTKASFIEEIRKYSKDSDLYGVFKKPSSMSASKETVYKKLELFHNDYICQRIVRENQYAEKVLRSLEQQSGLYVAPFYHNLVPGLGNLWLIKNFERHYLEAARSKATAFAKVAPTLVGKFMLMVENNTVLPSTPSSQVAIHSLMIMLSLIMDGVREPSMFLGKKKFYGFMSLCDAKCAELMFEAKDNKNHLAARQIEFLKWVLTFHTEDLMLVDTTAQKVVLNNMYAVTREDIYRTSPRTIQLRIQSEFTNSRKKRRPNSFLEMDEEENDDSFLQLESESVGSYEKKLRDENRRLLEEHGEKRRQEYRKKQLEKIREQQRREVQRQKEQEGSDAFQKAMRDRERVLRRAELQEKRARARGQDTSESPLFEKEEKESTEEQKEKPAENVKDQNIYENVKSKLDTLGSNYKVFLKRFMSGYHAPGQEVDPNGTSQSIVPFHVFVPSNKPTGGYDGQFIDVTQTLTYLINLANKDSNVYFYALNTFLMVRVMHSALHSFEAAKSKTITTSKTMGSLFRWLNTDSNRYISHLPKKYLPFASLSLQLVFFFQEVVESYTSSIGRTLKTFFKFLAKKHFTISLKRPRSFSRLNHNLRTQVVYNANTYKAALETLKEMVDLFKDTFIAKSTIPAPIIQFISVFTGLWAQADSETFSLSEMGTQRAKKMFLLSFLSNQKSLANMATTMILNRCKGLSVLHLGCVARVTSVENECNQLALELKKSRVLTVMQALEATSMDPLDVIRIASDTCRRCVANLTVRPHVGAPVLSALQMESSLDDDDSEDSQDEADSVQEAEEGSKAKEQSKEESKESEEKSKGSQGIKNLFKKKLSPEEEAMLTPHFTDRLMLHSEITQRMHCYKTQKAMVEALVKELSAAKDELDVRQIITNVFAQYRNIEVIQSGMASSIHRLVCPFMMDADESVRVPTQANILSYVINKVASKVTVNLDFKDLFQDLKSKIDLLIPSAESFQPMTDLPGCVFVGSRKYNGVYFSGGYAPFAKIDKPTNILLRPGEGRLVYDGDNFVPEINALQEVTDLVSINVVHERDFDRYVYQVRGENGPVMMTERAFALEYPNFVVRAHVLITAKALVAMGFDMGRVIWCGDRHGWVADFVLSDVVSISDVPVYNGQYWLLTSQLTVKDVVGSVPVRFVNHNVKQVRREVVDDEDEEHLPDKQIGGLDVEITARGNKVGEIKAHGPDEVASDEDEAAEQILTSSGGADFSATPGAVKSVRSASFNPVNHRLTLDLDMPDFVFGS